MSEKTRERILKNAFVEFLDKGFENASLREIAKLSDLTTGAIYGYFNSKVELFEALVKDAADGLYALVDKRNEDFFDRDIESLVSEFGLDTEEQIAPFMEYIYNYYDEFILILTKSRGTKYQFYIDKSVDFEIKNTIRFVDFLVNNGKIKKRPPNSVISVLSEHSILSMFDIITMGLSLEEAKEQVLYISNFYYVGWLNIINS